MCIRDRFNTVEASELPLARNFGVNEFKCVLPPTIETQLRAWLFERKRGEERGEGQWMSDTWPGGGGWLFAGGRASEGKKILPSKILRKSCGAHRSRRDADRGEGFPPLSSFFFSSPIKQQERRYSSPLHFLFPFLSSLFVSLPILNQALKTSYGLHGWREISFQIKYKL